MESWWPLVHVGEKVEGIRKKIEGKERDSGEIHRRGGMVQTETLALKGKTDRDKGTYHPIRRSYVENIPFGQGQGTTVHKPSGRPTRPTRPAQRRKKET